MSLDPKVQYHGVFYTDGGARPNPGQIGMGVHGYIFTAVQDKPLKKPKVIQNTFGEVLAYTTPTHTGYVECDREGRVAVNKNFMFVEPVLYVDCCNNSPITGTNNQAELRAFLSALTVTRDKGLRSVIIISDSQYTLSGVQSRRSENYRAPQAPVINSELWDVIMENISQLTADGVTIETKWAKGHISELGNTCADWLASIGVFRGYDKHFHDQISYSDAKGYWQPEIVRHPFLNFKRVYFNRLSSFNQPGQYYTADPGKIDDHIGKRTPDSGYAVVRLAQPDPVVETVRNRQFEYGQDFNAIMVIRMDRLFSKDVYRYIEQHGKYCLIGSEQNNCNLTFLDKSPVTVEQYPMGQMMRALDSLTLLEGILDSFEFYSKVEDGFEGFGHPSNNTFLRATDITDEFFETVEKKVGKEVRVSKELRSKFVVGYAMHLLETSIDTPLGVKAVKVPLTLGIDLPARNNLKRLEKSNPQVHLISWSESETTLRHACIIRAGGDIGIWSNFFADRILLKH